MEKTIGTKVINFSEDGYMTDLSQWDKQIGGELASGESVDMTDGHWEVVDYLQNQFKSEKSLSIRGIKKSGVVNIKEFYRLFPGGPLKISTKIAGIPKPKSCI